MNIALSAVIIFILLIGPIAFYISYSLGEFPKAGPRLSLLDSILASAIISLFIHTVAISIIGNHIRFDILIKLLGGEIKDVESKVSNRQFAYSIQYFTLYNGVILLLAIIFGRVARFIVIKNGLNTSKSGITRLNNRWYYLFNGYENNITSFDFVFIDAVVDTHDGTMIYSGFLINYVCSGEDLLRIYLGDVVRREFKASKQNEKGNTLINESGLPENIPGEIFCISYSNIINLNLQFILAEDKIENIEKLPLTSIKDVE